ERISANVVVIAAESLAGGAAALHHFHPRREKQKIEHVGARFGQRRIIGHFLLQKLLDGAVVNGGGNRRGGDGKAAGALAVADVLGGHAVLRQLVHERASQDEIEELIDLGNLR